MGSPVYINKIPFFKIHTEVKKGDILSLVLLILYISDFPVFKGSGIPIEETFIKCFIFQDETVLCEEKTLHQNY